MELKSSISTGPYFGNPDAEGARIATRNKMRDFTLIFMPLEKIYASKRMLGDAGGNRRFKILSSCIVGTYCSKGED